MSVKYSIVKMNNLLRPEEDPLYYAKAQVREEIGLQRIAEEIAYATSLTDGDVLNVIRGLIRKTKEHLADGDIVSLGDFGKFQFQISSRGAISASEFTQANIRKARFHFRPGKQIKELIPNLEYEEVISVKLRKEAKRAMKEG